jgi:hypothetical protein
MLVGRISWLQISNIKNITREIGKVLLLEMKTHTIYGHAKKTPRKVGLNIKFAFCF